jgi:glycerol-3-phosphate cytidylyltransferase
LKYKIGYVPGTFDLFHVGHLNIIKKAKTLCEYLICTVSTDELVLEHKNKKPIIPFEERIEIVSAIKYVDKAVSQINQDKFLQWQQYKFDAIFVGDDLKNTPKWLKYEEQLRPCGVDFVYFPYTKITSSTLILEVLNKLKGNNSGNE